MLHDVANIRHILVIEDQQGRRTLSLEEVKYSLGRKADNQIVIDSQHASRRHATLVKKGTDRDQYSYWILDGDLEGNKSHNGIYVNGTKCLVHELKDGDLINFGCEVNASYHAISALEEPQVQESEDLGISTLTQEEEGNSLENLHHNSTLILETINIVNFEDTIQDQAYLDSLTNLPNRYLFNEYLLLALNNAQRNNKLLGLILVDIEQLNKINHNFEYRVGDQLLQMIGARLKGSTRSGDIVARWGGDEFMILLPQINNASDLEKIDRRIAQTLQAAYEIENRSLPIQTSVSSVLYPKEGRDSKTLITQLGNQLAQVKRDRQDSSRVQRANLDAKATRASKMEYFLQQAIDNKELSLYYQPQVNIRTGEIEGLEVLLRWQHPQYGLIVPSRFLPLMEETEAILLINRWVLDHACQQALSWQKQGLLYTPISLNVSPRQFHDPQFPEMIVRVLTETGLKSNYLEIEMTETSLLDNRAETARIIHQLEQIGVGLSLDDFGIGYASIGYLSELPIKKLKIAQSLVKNLTKTPKNTAFIAAAIALGKCFQLTVIAEGVETQQQLEILQGLGCERMQGNQIGCPLPTAEITKFLGIHSSLSGQV